MCVHACVLGGCHETKKENITRDEEILRAKAVQGRNGMLGYV